jgi:aspartyl-tRNA(Asn)/glutamyl-tRNA(Gln) amidotransferase subunit C
MKISREDVLRVAELAHLELSEAEVETYRRQLDSILEYIGKLNELDTAGVAPMAQAVAAGSGANPSLRDDTPRADAVGQPVLEQAPEAAPPFFRVPRVIDR